MFNDIDDLLMLLSLESQLHELMAAGLNFTIRCNRNILNSY